MSHIVRYETPDDKGETRRQRNARFGAQSPDLEAPFAGELILEWFWHLSAFRGEGVSGPAPIRHADIRDWSVLSHTPLRPEEVTILLQLDQAYRSALSAEMADQAARREQASKKG